MGMTYRLRNVCLEPGGSIQDLCLRDGRLEELAPGGSGVEVEGNGGLLLPGMIDPHAHLRVPGMEAAEDWDSGSRAALRGGITTLFDMPNTNPPTTTRQRLEEKRTLARASRVNWGLHFGATAENAPEIAGAKNIASVKVYMGSSTGSLLVDDDEALERALRAAAKAGVLVCLHAEDEGIIRQRKSQATGRETVLQHGWLRPPEAAAAAVRRALAAGERTGASLYFCHVSTAAELDLLRAAKRKGRGVIVEATPHHLFLDESHLRQLGNYGKVNPPLRSPTDRTALWDAVADGTVDVIGTDHAPHTRESKERSYWEAPSGMPGLEAALPLLLTAMLQGRISFRRLLQLTSERSARAFGIEHNGWVLADIMEERPLTPDAVESRCGWNPFLGNPLRGWPSRVWVNDRLAFDRGKFATPGLGREVAFRSP